jgi:hypothetical protein
MKFLIFGIDEVNFFSWIVHYQFDEAIALESLFFSIACALSFAVCYIFSYKRAPINKIFSERPFLDLRSWRNQIFFMNFMGLVMISYILIVGAPSGFEYGEMTTIRAAYGFIYELRVLYLLLLSHLLLNITTKQFFTDHDLKFTRFVFIFYCIALLLFQARSVVFELAFVFIFAHLMWHGDRVKFKYILVIFSLLIVPNVIVLGRMGLPETLPELLDGLFSVEYSVMLDKFLGAAIYSGHSIGGFSFTTAFYLLIPSPIRNYFGMDYDFSFFGDITDVAGVKGGGFSLLAQLYSDFGWMALIVFGILGLIIGKFNSYASKVGSVGYLGAMAPLIYATFLVSLRNELGILIKYSIQVLVITIFFKLIFHVRTINCHEKN